MWHRCSALEIKGDRFHSACTWLACRCVCVPLRVSLWFILYSILSISQRIPNQKRIFYNTNITFQLLKNIIHGRYFLFCIQASVKTRILKFVFLFFYIHTYMHTYIFLLASFNLRLSHYATFVLVSSVRANCTIYLVLTLNLNYQCLLRICCCCFSCFFSIIYTNKLTPAV